MYRSRLYDLSAVPAGWDDDDFARAIAILEAMSRGDLQVLATRLNLRFPSIHPDDLMEEDIIDALLADYPKDELIGAIRMLE